MTHPDPAALDYAQTSEGGQRYHRDGQTRDEVYRRISDERAIFARNENNVPFYAKKANGDEYYPTINGKEISLPKDENPDVYAQKQNKDQYYPRDWYQNEYVIESSGGFFDYARKHPQGLFDAFYPRDADGDEIVHNNRYLFFQDGEVRYPLDTHGQPIYPYDPTTGDQMYVRSVQHVDSVAKALDGSSVYAKKQNKDEYYPHDPFTKEKYAYDVNGKPKYAMTHTHQVIFQKDVDQNEIYIRHENSDYTYTPDGKELPRYAKNADGSEIYPRRKDVKGKFSTEVVLAKRYAKNANHEPMYPLDDFNNEYTLHNDAATDDENYPLGYPVTHDRFFIIPNVHNKPYMIAAFTPPLSETHIECELRRNFNLPNDFLTRTKSLRYPRTSSENQSNTYRLYTTPYNLPTIGNTVTTSTTTPGEKTSPETMPGWKRQRKQEMYAIGIMLALALVMITAMVRQ